MKTRGIVALAALLLLAQGALGTETPGPSACDPACGSVDACARCGRHGPCVAKKCQLQCGVEKIKRHCWVVECEEFCPLLPGRRDGCDCGQCESCCPRARSCGCRQGDCCDQCGPRKEYVTPRCGHPRCVKKLVKKEYECEVPTYKCVVAYLCDQCCAGGGAPAAKPAAPASPTPAPLPPIPPKP